jgi:hypothetical protein
MSFHKFFIFGMHTPKPVAASPAECFVAAIESMASQHRDVQLHCRVSSEWHARGAAARSASAETFRNAHVDTFDDSSNGPQLSSKTPNRSFSKTPTGSPLAGSPLRQMLPAHVKLGPPPTHGSRHADGPWKKPTTGACSQALESAQVEGGAVSESVCRTGSSTSTKSWHSACADRNSAPTAPGACFAALCREDMLADAGCVPEEECVRDAGAGRCSSSNVSDSAHDCAEYDPIAVAVHVYDVTQDGHERGGAFECQDQDDRRDCEYAVDVPSRKPSSASAQTSEKAFAASRGPSAHDAPCCYTDADAARRRHVDGENEAQLHDSMVRGVVADAGVREGGQVCVQRVPNSSENMAVICLCGGQISEDRHETCSRSRDCEASHRSSSHENRHVISSGAEAVCADDIADTHSCGGQISETCSPECAGRSGSYEREMVDLAKQYLRSTSVEFETDMPQPDDSRVDAADLAHIRAPHKV